VDNRSEIRDFLTSRRAKITPDQAAATLGQALAGAPVGALAATLAFLAIR
jgi:hypothetical protein